MEVVLANYLSIGWQPLTYAVVFLGMTFGGEEVLIVLALFLNRGYLLFVPTFLAAYGGAITGDILWFMFGTRLVRIGFLYRLSQRVAFLRTGAVKKHDVSVIFLSKFLYGLSHISLAHLGMNGERFFRFIRYDFIASALWIVIVGGIGYGFSITLFELKHFLRFFEISLLLALVLFYVIEHIVAPHVKKFLERFLGREEDGAW